MNDLNDFIIHGETLSSEASLQVFHENTSRYKKKNSKNTNNQLFTIKYIKINAMGLKLVKITKD